MVRLKEHKFNLTRRGISPSGGPRTRVLLPLLIFIAVSLMLLSRLNHSALAQVRWRVAEWMSPVLQAAMVPLSPLKHFGRHIAEQAGMTEELQRLRSENQKLANWEWRARELERKLADLEGLAKAVDEPKLNFVTSQVIADSSGAFVRSVVISAGREQNVKSGYPVINGDGLVGRIVETGKSSARVLLPTDLTSRIPVVVGAKSVRAILAGDNGSEPRLTYLPQGAVISPGDDVATSGVGGLFPRGLRIGSVTGTAPDLRVKLRAGVDELEYLSVLFFENPALELIGDVPAEKAASGAQSTSQAGVFKERR